MKKELLLGTSMLLAIPSTLAASEIVPDGVKNVLSFIFGGVSPLAAGSSILWYLKALLWVMIFAVFFAALKRTFASHKNISVAIAFIASLIGVAFIPENIVLLVFSAYSLLTIALVVVLPVYFIVKLRGGLPKGNWRCLLMLAGAVLLLLLSGLFINIGESSAVSADLYSDVGTWSSVAAVILFFLALICFLTNLSWGNGGGESSSSSDSSSSDSGVQERSPREFRWNRSPRLQPQQTRQRRVPPLRDQSQAAAPTEGAATQQPEQPNQQRQSTAETAPAAQTPTSDAPAVQTAVTDPANARVAPAPQTRNIPFIVRFEKDPESNYFDMHELFMVEVEMYIGGSLRSWTIFNPNAATSFEMPPGSIATASLKDPRFEFTKLRRTPDQSRFSTSGHITFECEMVQLPNGDYRENQFVFYVRTTGLDRGGRPIQHTPVPASQSTVPHGEETAQKKKESQPTSTKQKIHGCPIPRLSVKLEIPGGFYDMVGKLLSPDSNRHTIRYESLPVAIHQMHERVMHIYRLEELKNRASNVKVTKKSWDPVNPYMGRSLIGMNVFEVYGSCRNSYAELIRIWTPSESLIRGILQPYIQKNTVMTPEFVRGIAQDKKLTKIIDNSNRRLLIRWYRGYQNFAAGHEAMKWLFKEMCKPSAKDTALEIAEKIKQLFARERRFDLANLKGGSSRLSQLKNKLGQKKNMTIDWSDEGARLALVEAINVLSQTYNQIRKRSRVKNLRVKFKSDSFSEEVQDKRNELNFKPFKDLQQDYNDLRKICEKIAKGKTNTISQDWTYEQLLTKIETLNEKFYHIAFIIEKQRVRNRRR